MIPTRRRSLVRVPLVVLALFVGALLSMPRALGDG